MEPYTYLGLTYDDWEALKEHWKATPQSITDLLFENQRLRGRVSFYESRIKQMAEVAAQELK